MQERRARPIFLAADLSVNEEVMTGVVNSNDRTAKITYQGRCDGKPGG